MLYTKAIKKDIIITMYKYIYRDRESWNLTHFYAMYNPSPEIYTCKYLHYICTRTRRYTIIQQ